MTMKEPLVSIILPTYNGAATIKQAFLSVRNQSFTDWELIVIDDCSDQDIQGILTEIFLDTPDCLTILRNSKNLGIQECLNIGLSKARGKYIARIDDDDEWVDKSKLEKQVFFLEGNSDHVLVGTGAVVLNGKRVEIFRYLLQLEDQMIRRKILSKNCFVHSSVVFRKETAMTFGGYDKSKSSKHAEDYNLWLKLGTRGKFCNLPIYSVALIDRTNSLTSSNRIIQAKSAIRQVVEFRIKYPNFFVGFFISIVRLLFFTVQNLLPLNKFWEARLKLIYKVF